MSPKHTKSDERFLPATRDEMQRLGWDALDVLLVTGDAYVDHPSFGAALLGRWLESFGYRVGMVAQPGWKSTDDVARLGRPRLFAGVTAGALDSMLAHYTAFRKLRRDDAYTPGGRHGARPNRATLVYTALVRKAFPGLPVVIGGIEASLRRASHYDFWSDSLRRSILLDSQADLLAYGMSERAVVELAQRIDSGEPITGIPGTAWVVRTPRGREPEGGLVPPGEPLVRLPSHEEIEANPKQLMTATLALEAQVHDGRSYAVQSVAGRTVVIAPPAAPLSTEELDRVYALPFARKPHPSYTEPIPAVEMIRFSITTHRGCAGGCSFCSLALHQGRRIASRSARSVVDEAKTLTRHDDWKGSISDVGGPTANLFGARCLADPSKCSRVSCLFPAVCPSFQCDQEAIAHLLREVQAVSGVKSVRVASGIRHDVALADEEYVRTLVGEFTGGQLKLAPEHCETHVLELMRKPGFDAFTRFLTLFERVSKQSGKKQYVIPYLISAFPGCTDADMRRLAAWLKARRWRPQQVQCFIPTPGAVATAMFHAGIDPDGNPIEVARTDAERLRQHRILMGKSKG